MYTEEPKKEINWGSLFKKVALIVIVVLFMFLIFWLIIRNNGNNKNVNINSNQGNNYQNSTLQEKYYTSDFIENYRYFHDTAKEYFLVNELPEKGRSLKYTLKELIDKGLILPFGYKNQTCDLEASYALVTNIDGKYNMTITLVCGTEVGKTNEDLGCNQLCTNGNCTQTPETPNDDNEYTTYTTEYEYKQSYKENLVSYSCPSGYIKDGNRCYKQTSSSIKPTVTANYTCPTGYTKSGSGANTVCIKNDSNTVNATATTTYTCPSGYTKSGSGANTVCIKNGSTTVNATATTTYTCPAGYTKYGTGLYTSCIKNVNDVKYANYSESYTCPAGYTQVGYGINGRCVKTSSYTYKAHENISAGNCPSGYTKSGNYCVKKTNYIPACSNGYTYSNGTCVKTVKVGTPSTTCASGYTKSGSTCVANSATSSALKKSYYCSTGKLEGTQCKITRTTSSFYTSKTYLRENYNGCVYSGYTPDKCGTGNCTTGTYTYYCPAGSSYYQSASVSYSCASGYTQKGSGSSAKCYKTDSSKLTTYCSTGTLSSDKKSCVKTDSNSSYFNPTCPSGYTKSGSGFNTVCSISQEYITEVELDCPNGGVLKGDYCYVENTETVAQNKNVNYYCSDPSYTLSGSTCYKNATDVKLPTVNTTYTCSQGTLQGTKCVIGTSDVKNPTTNTTYTCSEGTLQGTKCVINSSSSKNATVTNTYTCPKGYNKYGENSSTICSKNQLEYIDATPYNSQTTKYRYKWSTETNIEGWERTGNTRKIKSTVKEK